MTAAQIVAVRLGDRVQVNFRPPFVGHVVAVDGLLIRLRMADDSEFAATRHRNGKPVEFWVNMRDDPVERLGADI